MACNELPKSLKTSKTVGNDDSGVAEADEHDLNSSKDQNGVEDVKIFDVIVNQTAKLRKMKELFDCFLEDVLDEETVRYFKNTAVLRKLDGKVEETDIKSNSEESCSADRVKSMKEEVEKFDKERVSAPNPFIFLCTAKDFLAKHKHVEPTIVADMEDTLVDLSNKLCDQQDN